MSSTPKSRQEYRLKRLAWFLDSSIRLPGGFRIGAESIVGLIPGIGDTIGALVSSYIVFEAAKLGVSKSILFKMIGNVILETVVGIIPIVGDIFDMAYKANMRNVLLLETHISEKNNTNTELQARSNKKIITLILLVFLALIIMFIWLAIQIFSLFINLLSQI